MVQAYLFRTEKDIQDVLQAEVARPTLQGRLQGAAPNLLRKKERHGQEFCVKLMQILLKSGVYHGIATHDPEMIRATKEFEGR